MPERTHVIAGTCTATFDGDGRDRDQYGDVLVVVKPDGTTLVHDAAGYQPVAWLTRPESVTLGPDAVTATDGDQRLSVEIHETRARDRYSASEAGVPVGDCPCGGRLVRARGAVTCPACDARYGLPTGASVTDESCADCGLPRIRVRRGATFLVCLDRDCDPLDDRVRAAFDREWDCPDCGGDLRVLRRGGLVLGCERYPDCETSYAFPEGVRDGVCTCGLPAFETPSGRRCPDSGCDRRVAGAGDRG
jgi:DNA topoisomerase-1